MNAKHIRMIQDEHSKACEKHPKFCDELTPVDFPWDSVELDYKGVNSKEPFFASDILGEEIAEAMAAHQHGDREHCLQELAQCGAVILRMMQYVEETRWANGDTCKKVLGKCLKCANSSSDNIANIDKKLQELDNSTAEKAKEK